MNCNHADRGRCLMLNRELTACDCATCQWHPTAPPSAVQHGPGNVLAGVIHALGFSPTGQCGCAAMQAKMNAGGWRWCWDNRTEILAFLKTKAHAAGVPFDEATVWAALKAALWAWEDKQSDRQPKPLATEPQTEYNSSVSPKEAT